MPADADTSEIDPALAEAIRRTYVREVDATVAARHVAALAEAARGPEATQPAPTAAARHIRRRRASLWRPALAAIGAVLTIPVGLAGAGVRLPAPVGAPYLAVGIELPNQDPARAPAPRRRPGTRPEVTGALGGRVAPPRARPQNAAPPARGASPDGATRPGRAAPSDGAAPGARPTERDGHPRRNRAGRPRPDGPPDRDVRQGRPGEPGHAGGRVRRGAAGGAPDARPRAVSRS